MLTTVIEPTTLIVSRLQQRLSLGSPSETLLLYRPVESYYYPQPKSAAWLRCYQHYCVYQVRNPDTERRETGKRSNTTREQREGQGRGSGGGSENRRDLYVSRHDDPRTEVWRGCTPKVPKLQGLSEPNPESRGMEGVHTRNTEVVGRRRS